MAEGSGGTLLAIDAEGNLPAGGWELLAAASTIVMGSTTYMGGPSWQLKKLADASSKRVWLRPWPAWAGHTVCGDCLRGPSAGLPLALPQPKAGLGRWERYSPPP